ncbi:MAG TPA: 50S ribosomal protein L21 [Myxococcota bacterium]|jgi:large subunit ribosomal protein L21|nr:50S ribosomal protein L21 [Myxococcota bacterium]
MYAVVRSGGKQFRVSPGDVVDVERVEGEPGQSIELGEVLLVGGDKLVVGKPLVAGAKVMAKIEGDSAGPKIRIFKYKRRKRYRLTKGHRQHFTRVRIESIEV